MPKLPIMLLNGAEGIGTGFSSVIPSFNHKDIIASMTKMIETGKSKSLKPHVANFKNKIEIDKGRLLFRMVFEEIGGKIFITEIPRNYDAIRLYKYLNKYIEDGFLKDYIDSSVDNEIMVELVFKRGQTPTIGEVEKKMAAHTSMSPNYTLISERGIRIFNNPEQIIEIFTLQRLEVVKRRYELLCKNLENKIRQNNEIIKFIKNKEYEVATRSANRKSFVDYLKKKKDTFNEYLADMPIYRMTKEEVSKRKLMVQEDKKNLAEYTKISKSKKLVQKKLIQELKEVDTLLDDWVKKKAQEKEKLFKKTKKKTKKRKVR